MSTVSDIGVFLPILTRRKVIKPAIPGSKNIDFDLIFKRNHLIIRISTRFPGRLFSIIHHPAHRRRGHVVIIDVVRLATIRRTILLQTHMLRLTSAQLLVLSLLWAFGAFWASAAVSSIVLHMNDMSLSFHNIFSV